MDKEIEKQLEVLRGFNREVKEFLSYAQDCLGNHIDDCLDLERVLEKSGWAHRGVVSLSEVYPLVNCEADFFENNKFVVFEFSRDNYYAYLPLDDIRRYFRKD